MTVPNGPEPPSGQHRPARRRISKEDQSALNALVFRWDTAFMIAFDGDVWSASPLDDPATVLTAESATDLRELMRDDYQRNKRRNLREPWQGCSL